MSRVAAQQEAIASRFPAFQPIEKTHTDETGAHLYSGHAMPMMATLHGGKLRFDLAMLSKSEVSRFPTDHAIECRPELALLLT